MWVKNTDSNTWERQKDELNNDIFNLIKEDIKKLRYYSKCTDGTAYLPINNLDDIYDIVTLNKNEEWYIGASSSTYSIVSFTASSTNKEVLPSNLDSYKSSLYEYNFSLKNLFTPTKTINDQIKNYLEVDVATTEHITDLLSDKILYVIDGNRLIDKHRVLVKNQITNVTLPNTTDPETYFDCNYYITSSDDVNNTIDYFFYNSDNGIYKYQNNKLVRESDLDDYNICNRYSVVVKLGDVNFDKQYHLSRLKNGYYPTTLNNNNIEFIEKHNWILRNKIEYQDILSVTYNDMINTQSYIIGSSSVPDRNIIVGNFGTILNNQDNRLNLIFNKYKENLYSVAQTSKHYYICGENGTLLQLDKITLNIKHITIDTFYDLKSISFFDDMNGMTVGKHNTIFYTLNGGYNWIKLDISIFENLIYNKVLWATLTNVYIAGNEGTFIELIWINNEWNINKYNIPKNVNNITDDTYYVIDNIYDLKYKKFDATTSWTFTAGTYSPPSVNKECIFLSGENGLLGSYDLNNFLDKEKFILLKDSTITGNITNIEFKGADMYIAADNIYAQNINQFNTLNNETNIMNISTQFATAFSGTYSKIYNYFDFVLYGVGELSKLDVSLYGSPTMSLIDPTYGASFSPRFLFLDYDIASKVNFFDYNFNYRLPTATSVLPHNSMYFDFNGTFLDYHKDTLKEFEYNTSLNQSNAIVYSTTFNKLSIGDTNTLAVLNTDISKDLYTISTLAPTFIGGNIISAPTQSYGLYLYQDIMVLSTTASLPSTVGDVFELNSMVVNDIFTVNKIYSSGGINYLYFYSNFNEGIINDLVSATSGVVFTNLNTYRNDNGFVNNFNKHRISTAYTLKNNPSDIDITAKLNEKTAYYNLELNGICSFGTIDMVYDTKYLNFGYVPNYNLSAYLSNINSTVFSSSKEFISMPIYNGLPTNSTYVDVSSNKILFDVSQKFLWETFYIHTFLDITVHGNAADANTSKFLVTEKYFDTTINKYVLEGNKKINIGLITTTSVVDIKSRRLLSEISVDLTELDNISRPYNQKIIDNSQSFFNYESALNARFSTDSYAKILLNDIDIRNNITAIVYQDYKNELAINITNLKNNKILNIVSTNDYFGSLQITCDDVHSLTAGNMVILDFPNNNTSTTSYTLNPMYNGSRIVSTIIDDYTFTVAQSTNITVANDYGTATVNISDPYFNYTPVDIIDVGINKKEKKSVTITEDNLIITDKKYSLVNLNLNKFKFHLVDGLNFDDLGNTYQWLLEAEIDNAIIGKDDTGIIWYQGLWNCGRFFGSKWYSGIWRGGEWYGNDFYSYQTVNNFLSVTVDYKNPNSSSSKWLNGNWHSGTFHNATWFDGTFYNGTWDNGIFLNGQIDYVDWYNGLFKGGTWVNGIWRNGTFNADNNQAYWIDGKFMGGDFESGEWFNGEFMPSKDNTVNFGTKSNNTKKAIFHGGKFNNGSLYSFKDTEDGLVIASIDNRFTVIESGVFNNSTIYGGTIYGGSFENSKILNVVVFDYSVTAISAANDTIGLNDIHYYNIGDVIIVNDRNVTNANSGLGSNNIIKKYIVTRVDRLSATTNLKVNQNITLTASGSTGEYIVPYFKNVDWYNGIVYNALFEDSIWRGGMFLGGVFNSSTWCY